MATPFRLGVLALVSLLLVGPLRAQQAASESHYPTVAALQDAVIPRRDRIELAQRIFGVRELAAPPSSAQERQIGEQETFWVSDLTADDTFQVSATLRVTGEHIYLWVEDGIPVTDADLRALADAFDSRIYSQVRDVWGNEDAPGIDGDPRIYGLFARGIGLSTLAYFTTQHVYPAEVVATSNQHEMFVFNADALDGSLLDLASTTAHEFQHMIRHNVDGNEDTWLDEGFSVFTERYLGYDSPLGFALSFLEAPDTQLNAWTEDESRTADYGAAFLFVTYFYERFGLQGIRALSQHPANGLESIDKVAQSLGALSADDLFADWALANFLLDPSISDGRYGYRTLWPGLPGATPRAVLASYPYAAQSELNQYATDYYVLAGVRGKTALEISLTRPSTVQLVPATPASRRWMWYSNRGDESDMTLTRAFDLSDVASATLTYRTWYHLEEPWDYAYLMVSGDGGAKWSPLETPYTTLEDPHDNAYGPGYTGESGGWLTETITLDDYAGQRILMRFELITDDAITQPGIVIDDVAIPEIDYFSDFETDGGGWDARGWIRTDNILPQRVWMQAVQQAGRDVIVTRWLALSTGDAAQHWTLPLAENVDQVLLAISPFAPVTTVPMPYTLNVGIH